MTPDAATLLGRLCAVTEQMVDHAKVLDGAALAALAPERQRLIEAIAAAPRPEPGAVRADVQRLRALEVRLATIARLVTESFDRATPGAPPPTYGRDGRFAG